MFSRFTVVSVSQTTTLHLPPTTERKRALLLCLEKGLKNEKVPQPCLFCLEWTEINKNNIYVDVFCFAERNGEKGKNVGKVAFYSSSAWENTLSDQRNFFVVNVDSVETKMNNFNIVEMLVL